MGRIFIALAALFLAQLAAPAWAGLQEDLATKEAVVAKLRAEVEPLAKPFMVNGRDLRAFLSLSPIVDAIDGLNARSQEKRTIAVQSTGRNGYFWENGGDWCGSYVELDHADSLRANAVISNFGASIRDDGALTMGGRTDVNGRVQFKFQFMGPRVSKTIGICPICVKANACAPEARLGLASTSKLTCSFYWHLLDLVMGVPSTIGCPS